MMGVVMVVNVLVMVMKGAVEMHVSYLETTAKSRRSKSLLPYSPSPGPHFLKEKKVILPWGTNFEPHHRSAGVTETSYHTSGFLGFQGLKSSYQTCAESIFIN